MNGTGTAEKKKLTYFLEVSVLDAVGAEVAKLVAESEDDGLAAQACGSTHYYLMLPILRSYLILHMP